MFGLCSGRFPNCEEDASKIVKTIALSMNCNNGMNDGFCESNNALYDIYAMLY